MGVLLKINKRNLEITLILLLLASFRLSSHLPDVPLCFAGYWGFGCPTCGTTRSLWSILHGDFLTAWRLNPLGFLVLLALTRRLLILAKPSRSMNVIIERSGFEIVLIFAFLLFGYLRLFELV